MARQLASVRETLHRNLVGHYNSHWKLGQSLNAIRAVLRHKLTEDEQSTFDWVVAPVSVDRHAPYTLETQDAMRLCDQLLSYVDSPTDEKQTASVIIGPIQRVVPRTQGVFIIHGHDHTNTLRLRSILKERFHLNPIVLSEQASRGRTLIEKFEDEAASASFAFALLTPDDIIFSDASNYAQARPNVIFELGWFYGRLGRHRVCILFQEGTAIPSDLDGILRVPFKVSVEESLLGIETELRAAGLIGNDA